DKDDDEDFAMPLIPFNASLSPLELEAEMRKFTKMQEKIEEAKAAIEKDLAKGLALAAEIPPKYRPSLLASAVLRGSAKNPELGNNLLEKCATLLAETKDPGDRVMPWAKSAEAAHTIKNDKLAREALQHALADLGDVYNWDTDATTPNRALPEYWPSIV